MCVCVNLCWSYLSSQLISFESRTLAYFDLSYFTSLLSQHRYSLADEYLLTFFIHDSMSSLSPDQNTDTRSLLLLLLQTHLLHSCCTLDFNSLFSHIWEDIEPKLVKMGTTQKDIVDLLFKSIDKAYQWRGMIRDTQRYQQRHLFNPWAYFQIPPGTSISLLTAVIPSSSSLPASSSSAPALSTSGSQSLEQLIKPYHDRIIDQLKKLPLPFESPKLSSTAILSSSSTTSPPPSISPVPSSLSSKEAGEKSLDQQQIAASPKTGTVSPSQVNSLHINGRAEGEVDPADFITITANGGGRSGLATIRKSGVRGDHPGLCIMNGFNSDHFPHHDHLSTNISQQPQSGKRKARTVEDDEKGELHHTTYPQLFPSSLSPSHHWEKKHRSHTSQDAQTNEDEGNDGHDENELKYEDVSDIDSNSTNHLLRNGTSTENPHLIVKTEKSTTQAHHDEDDTDHIG